MISFECRGRRLTGRLIGGEFIRYQSRFPAGYSCRAEVPAAPFIEAVRRVSLVADRASPVRLTFGQGQVMVEAQTEGRARAAEAVAASFEGDEPAIAFNPHYLLDGLTAAAASSGPARQPADTEATPAQAAAAAAIRLEFTSPAKPALITLAGEGGEEPGGEDGEAGPAAGPSFRYLVVPLRSPTRA
jgi:DNA polymerase-3 subunit beta